MITGLTLISGTPRKNGKISILLETDKTTENMRSLVELYEKSLSLDIEPTEGRPSCENGRDDDFWLLVEIRSRCQQMGDLIKDRIGPIPTPAANIIQSPDEIITDLGGEREPLTAPDEFPAIHDSKVDMMKPILNGMLHPAGK